MEGFILFLVLGIGLLIFLVIVAALLFGGLRTSLMFTVHTQEAVIVERFGKFKRVAQAGLNFKTPFIDSTTKPVSLRVQQLEVNIESKTKDNVFVNVPVAVQYRIREEQVIDAYYKLSNPEAQIRSYVFDTVRSALSSLELDEAFESKDDIARSVESTLSARMQEFGFNIINTLVQDISTDSRVRDSMNSINAAQRDRVAAQSLAEADKIKRVTQAQAESEAMRLHGEGVAAQRKAIANGIAEQYALLQEVGIHKTAEQLLMMTQYFDTMQNVAQEGRSNVLFMPSNPGGLGEMGQEIRNALFAANAADEGSHLPAPQGRDDAGGDSRSSSGNGADGTNVPPQPTTPPADRSGQYVGGQGQGGSGQGTGGQGQSQHGGQGHSDPRSAAQSAVRAAAEQWRNRRGGNQG